MKMIRIIFFLCIFFFFESFTFQLAPNAIVWDEARNLTWNDFKGKPEKTSPYLALTTSGIYFSINGTPSDLKIEVKSYFDPSASWRKEENDELLRHEQWHFNITEIFARKMRKEMLKMVLKKSSIKQQLSQLHAQINSNCKAYQQKYDNETDHSKKPEKQKEWEKKLLIELKELANFSNTSLSLKVQN